MKTSATARSRAGHTRSWAALLLVLTLLLAACGGDGGGGEGGAEEAAAGGSEAATGGGSEGGSGAGEDVAVVLKTLAQPFWLYVQSGAEAAAENTGANVTFAAATTEADVMEQVDKVRAAITQQVDALVVSPTQPAQLEPILQQAVDQGIPVVLIDTPMEGWDGAESFIGTDNFAAGQTAAEFAVEQTDPGSVALLSGVPGNASTDQRIAGFKEVATAEGYEVVAELSANSDRAEGRAVMADILQQNPEVSVVFAANDEMALGAVEAIEGAGLAWEDVLVIGVDGTEDAVAAIQGGAMDASIAQNPYEMGRLGVESAVDVINGQDIEDRIDTGVTVVTEQNADTYLAQLQEQLP